MKTAAKWLVRTYFTLVGTTFAYCSWLAYDADAHQLWPAMRTMWEIGLAIVVIVAAALLPLLLLAVLLERSSGNAPGLSGPSRGPHEAALVSPK